MTTWILLVDSSHVILLQFCIPNFLDDQPEFYGTGSDPRWGWFGSGTETK